MQSENVKQNSVYDSLRVFMAGKTLLFHFSWTAHPVSPYEKNVGEVAKMFNFV